MKKNFNVKIHKTGSLNDMILRVVGNFNDGKAAISLVDIQSYVTFNKSAFPSLYDGYYATRDEDDDSILRISEDGGESFTLTIEEIELHELDGNDSIEHRQGEVIMP